MDTKYGNKSKPQPEDTTDNLGYSHTEEITGAGSDWLSSLRPPPQISAEPIASAPSFFPNKNENPPPYSDNPPHLFPSNSGYPAEAFAPPVTDTEPVYRAEGYPKDFFAEIPGNHDVMDFTVKSIRRGFIRKVFAILLLQLLVTLGMIALFVFHSGIKTWVRKNPILIVGSGIAVLILSIMTYCWESLRRKSPYNLILLFTLTLAYAVLAASISAYFTVDSVMYAIGITFSVCLGLILFSMQTKFKFTSWSGLLVLVLILGLAGGIFAILINQGVIPDKDNVRMRFLFGCIGALLLSVFLIYDLRRIVKGSHKFSVNPEEYVLAALGVYVDFIFIFIVVIIILGICVLTEGKGGDCAGGGGGGGHFGGCWICCIGGPYESDEERKRRREQEEEDNERRLRQYGQI